MIAIVGRPNVGKSTLFNRLIGKRYAITSKVAGTTRDRIFHEAMMGSFTTILVDTGGLEFGKNFKNLEENVQEQARIGLSEADLLFFLIDATEPLTKSDLDAAQLLRKANKPIILIAHKVDNKLSKNHMDELVRLGLGEPLQLSSIHDIGVDELIRVTAARLKTEGFSPKKVKHGPETRIAIVGRPNVGKSSIINGIIGEERLIVSDIQGTTIDATDTAMKVEDKEYVLIDTAGLRKRSKRGFGLEGLGGLRSLRAISRCDVACLVVDWTSGLTSQDLHVSQYILEAGKGMIIIVNKVDQMESPEADRKQFLRELQYKMNYVPWAPVLFTSALEKKNLNKILELSGKIQEERSKKISDAAFTTFIKTTTVGHPPTRKGKAIRIMGGKQTDTCPPSFTILCNKPELLHFSYKRYLENELRRHFGFEGTSIEILVSERAPKKNAPKKLHVSKRVIKRRGR